MHRDATIGLHEVVAGLVLAGQAVMLPFRHRLQMPGDLAQRTSPIALFRTGSDRFAAWLAGWSISRATAEGETCSHQDNGRGGIDKRSEGHGREA